MMIGYARVSTPDQSLDLQLDALKRVGCERIFTDTASGTKTKRNGLGEALDHLRSGDVLVVWRLDRLGRSLGHLIEIVQDLHEKGAMFRSLAENMDTGTSGGMLVFNIFGSLAQFEKELIRERTLAGLAAARARGREGGRPKAMDRKKIDMAKSLLADPKRSISEVCDLLGVSRSTLYRHVGAVNPVKSST